MRSKSIVVAMLVVAIPNFGNGESLPGASSSVAVSAPAIPASVEPAVDGAAVQKPFATIGDEVISGEEFTLAVRDGVRRKYYHAKVPEGEMAKFQRVIGQQLIDRVLLLKEAKSIGLQPDSALVKKQVDEYEQRYANSPGWQANRDKMLPVLTSELEKNSLLKRLEEKVRQVPTPDLQKLQAYYQAHPDKFTEPMDQKVSVILVGVDPSAGNPGWVAGQKEADKLIAQLRQGASFEELAKEHSTHESAKEGGKLVYTHRGMLSEQVEKALDKLEPGQFTDPLVVLEGIGIFRLDNRTPAKLLPFEKVQERAIGLLMREESELAWENLKKALKEKSKITINMEYYLPLLASEPSANIPDKEGAKVEGVEGTLKKEGGQ
ncbi:MAG: peptidyl-prolyl cis-trans isomerase [Magnetococcus sp. DMHC-6]